MSGLLWSEQSGGQCLLQELCKTGLATVVGNEPTAYQSVRYPVHRSQGMSVLPYNQFGTLPVRIHRSTACLTTRYPVTAVRGVCRQY
jgi:hypothetical protein